MGNEQKMAFLVTEGKLAVGITLTRGVFQVKKNVQSCHKITTVHQKRLHASNSDGSFINCLSFVTEYQQWGTALELMKAQLLYFKGSYPESNRVLWSSCCVLVQPEPITAIAS